MSVLDVLTHPPAPLTRGQRAALVAATVVAAGSRFLARGHSMWDWDEALFCLGVRDYNVVQHHPHPPGYPLFIAAAKLVRLAVHSDLLALQIVVMLSGAVLLPLLFFFAREARFPFATAFGGALIVVFLPNVWIYSGSAMSDVPSLALTLLACALLLRGCRSRRAYIAGAICLGLAAGIRPQALMVGVACGAIATIVQWRQNRRVVVAAALLGAGAIAVCTIGAAAASDPPGSYFAAVRLQSKWVRNVDSYHNPGRTPLRQLAPLFFYKPVAANAVQLVSILAALGAVIGVATRRFATLVALATFVPFAIFAWLMLDPTAVSRYAIGYMPLYALLAADALAIAFSFLPRGKEIVPAAASVILAASLAWWTWPAAKRIRANDAPHIAAIRWVMHNAWPGAGTVFVHNGFGPFAEYFLAPYEKRYFESYDDIPSGGYVEPAFILTGELSKAADAHVFARPHDRLWRIVRQRYFEASVIPAWDLVRFGRGWHDAEGDGGNNWRWMTASSEILLPPAGARSQLTLQFYVPMDALPAPPSIEVTLNGALVERFTADALEMKKSWTVAGRDGGGANELRISTSGAIVPARAHPGGDSRELGLKLLAITWQPSTH
ncbi:MAG: hypothetical protein AABO58_02190 [Acidobacteriota bacterium]